MIPSCFGVSQSKGSKKKTERNRNHKTIDALVKNFPILFIAVKGLTADALF
jgi:hypothetical protein